MTGPVAVPCPQPASSDELPEGDRAEANVQLLAGLGLGAYVVGSLAVLGSVCPVCIVASPLLLGAGLVNRRRANKRARQAGPTD